jgi:hypothetical protein
MVKLAAHGIAVQLPDGWEGSITSGRGNLDDTRVLASGAVEREPDGLPVAHFATFGLPVMRSDFGGAVAPQMGADDVFVALLEYGREEATSALFANEGFPRRLDPRDFNPQMLQRMVRGQSGLQLFFHEGGRAFCLYVVLGDAGDAHRLVRRVERLLAAVEIGERT